MLLASVSVPSRPGVPAPGGTGAECDRDQDFVRFWTSLRWIWRGLWDIFPRFGILLEIPFGHVSLLMLAGNVHIRYKFKYDIGAIMAGSVHI